MSRSVYLRNAILDALGNNTSFAVSQVYVSLHTGDPGLNGASEVSGGSYAREAVSFGAASGGAMENDALVRFDSVPAGTITHFGLWDAASAGNFLWGAALTASKTQNDGDPFEFAIGAIDVSEAA
jgi:hypothetical protein